MDVNELKRPSNISLKHKLWYAETLKHFTVYMYCKNILLIFNSEYFLH
jgi:hypothetical protein